jgi:hypothetical protein
MQSSVNKTREQILVRKCIHFNGVMNECCRAGVKYEDVSKNRQFPCLSEEGAVHCEKSQYPTPEEAKAKEKKCCKVQAGH